MFDRLRRLWLGTPKGHKNFSGSIFDRLRGLDFILTRCAGCSVLDIGSNDGLISYEFARNGISLVHGFEKNRHRVAFANRLFRDVPIESRFVSADLAVSGVEFERRHQSLLLRRYDIVLFLGVYHHLRSQMPKEELQSLVEVLLDKAETWFVDRGGMRHEYEPMIASKGFELLYTSPKIDGKGATLCVFRKGGREVKLS